MKYSKLSYDLNGSAYQPRQLAVPTDSTYAIGIELVKDGNRVKGEADNYKLVDGDVEISATTTLNGMGIFELTSTSNVDDDKTYTVKYHQAQPVDVKDSITVDSFETDYLRVALSTLVGLYDGSVKYDDVLIAPAAQTVEGLSYRQPTVYKYYPNTGIVGGALIATTDNKKTNTLKYFMGKSNDSEKTGWVKYDSSKAGAYVTDNDIIDLTFQDMIDDGAIYIYWGDYTGLMNDETRYFGIKYGKEENYSFAGLQINQIDDGEREIDTVGGVKESTFEFVLADGSTKTLKVLTTED